MEAGNLVAADRARTVDELLPGNARLGSQRRRVLGQIRRIQSALLLARSFAAAVVVLRLVGRQTQSARWMLLMLMLMLVLVVVVMVVMMAGSTSRLAFDLQVSNAGQ
jgi:peptidoglycan/LPS O-acetylase OafA/YrhL